MLLYNVFCEISFYSNFLLLILVLNFVLMELLKDANITFVAVY